jgi:urease accessory protein
MVVDIGTRMIKGNVQREDLLQGQTFSRQRETSQEQLLAALQLSSPALPIGAFSYSQGLESAVAAGIVNDELSLQNWVAEGLEFSFGMLELPVWCLQHQYWSANQTDIGQCQALELDDWFLASRETEELRLETEQMGWSAQALLRDWAQGNGQWQTLLARRPVSLPTVMSALAVFEGVDIKLGATAYAFAWLEGQVMAGSKSIPLGQAAIQRVIRAQRVNCILAVNRALKMERGELQTFSPGLALLSSQHETLYTRLYRS